MRKKYILFWIAVLCLVLEAYVIYTPDPRDDELPAKLKEALLLLVSNETDSEYDDKETDYVTS